MSTATLQPPTPILVDLARLTPNTCRECFLAAKRSTDGLTFDESAELLRLQRAAYLRAEADQAAELHTEGRTFRTEHVNPHGD